jgi:hypothetical protein
VLALDAIRGRYLDVRFRTRGGARARIVERPGLWMGEAEQDALIADLRAVVRASVADPGQTLEYGVLKDRTRMDRVVLTIIYRPERDEPVAFNALHVLACELRGRREDVVHLGLTMIDPAYRQRGLAAALYGTTCFLLCARQQMRPLWISNVTQVPSVFGLVSAHFVDVFPSVRAGARRPFSHLQLARQVASRYRDVYGAGPEAEFDEEQFVLSNAYTEGSRALKKRFADAPMYRDEAVNAYCRDHLDYDRGDDFVQIGRFTASVARKYFTRSVPLISPIFLLTQATMLFVESLYGPVMQWLTPDRAMGPLRPASEPGITP